MRGNPPPEHAALAGGRSIPACAGEPPTLEDFPEILAVYPRVCGGTMVGNLVDGKGAGLSPRVRGNLQDPAIRTLCVGSIPACAGEPPCKQGI